jgi:hypothetical protein
MERRDFIQAMGLVAGATAAASLIDQPALAETTAKPDAKLPFRIESDSMGQVQVPADTGGADPALARALQHWPRPNAAGDDHRLCHTQACRRRVKPHWWPLT